MLWDVMLSLLCAAFIIIKLNVHASSQIPDGYGGGRGYGRGMGGRMMGGRGFGNLFTLSIAFFFFFFAYRFISGSSSTDLCNMYTYRCSVYT